ncbi:prepilin peptidase [Aureimonas sp. AU4]|uniref:prepilin peptidase n=1 Tax=Aureimonas sp. AU4 TaxID=1638163 RepID=UPI000706A053|nr:prepilin peptidase [Aureimonas sp. AU4]BAT30578.1 peptidase A24A prepilin type IV [Aureimonas sp. AU4]
MSAGARLAPGGLAGWGATTLLIAGATVLSGRTGWMATLALPAALGFVCAWIAWEDLAELTIPDAALAGMVGLAAVDLASTALFRFDPASATGLFALDGLLCGGALWVLREIYFRRRGHDGIGFGDVKLAVAGGCLCGFGGFSLALLAASLAGLVVAALAARRGAGRWEAKIAFGALLAPALCAAWLLGVGR